MSVGIDAVRAEQAQVQLDAVFQRAQRGAAAMAATGAQEGDFVRVAVRDL